MPDLGHFAGEGEAGHCFATGVPTTNRLPNGLFLCEQCRSHWLELGWLSKNEEFTDAFFDQNKRWKKEVGPKGEVILIDGAEDRPLPLESIFDELRDDPFTTWAANPMLTEADFYRFLWGLGEWSIRAWCGAALAAEQGLLVAVLISRGRLAEQLPYKYRGPEGPSGCLTTRSLQLGKYTAWAGVVGFFPSRFRAVIREVGRFSHFMKDGNDPLQALDSLRLLFQACNPGFAGVCGGVLAPLSPPLLWEVEDYSSELPSRAAWQEWFASQGETIVCEESTQVQADGFWRPSESFLIVSPSVDQPRVEIALKARSNPNNAGGFKMSVEINEEIPARLWTKAGLFLERYRGLFVRLAFKDGLRLLVPRELFFRSIRQWGAA